MNIENVDITLISRDRRDANNYLRAYARLDLVSGRLRFVLRDLKIITNERHGLLVVMPSRVVDFHCDFCRCNNVWTAAYCNRCGGALPQRELPRNSKDVEIKSYDVFFPTDQNTRAFVSEAVICAYRDALFDADC